MTALVLTTTTFTLERKKIFGSFFTATNELLLGLVDEKLTSFQYPLAFFASIPHYRSTPLREVSISMGRFPPKCLLLKQVGGTKGMVAGALFESVFF